MFILSNNNVFYGLIHYIINAVKLIGVKLNELNRIH